MDQLSLAPLIALLPLLILSSFASSSETALFSLDRFQMRNLRERHKASYNHIKTLLAHPTRLLIVILMINEIANLSIANVITRFVESIHPWLAQTIGGPFTAEEPTLLLTITLTSMFLGAPITLIIGEVTPKIIASRLNRLIAAINSRLLILLYRLFFPLLWIFDALITLALRSFGAKGKSHLSKFTNPLDESDFVELLEEAHKEGSLEPSERHLIYKVFRLDDIRCSQVMKPMADTFMVEASMQVKAVMKDIEQEKYSRIPVFSKTRKNVVGVLYVKDLVNFNSAEFKVTAGLIKDLMVKPMTVSSSTNLSALLRRFKRSKMHLAIVTDKTQQAIGIITLEDVLESIFGEIEDERDINDN